MLELTRNLGKDENGFGEQTKNKKEEKRKN